MKKTRLLHGELSGLVARLGHGDMIVIGDAGLPIPEGPQRIDLALTANIPRLVDVVGVILHEMKVERAIIAEEFPIRSQGIAQELIAALGDIPLTTISHEELKAISSRARAVVRTGEFSPYANVILCAGVVF